MSVMTRGVIQMPYNLAMNSELNRRQFYSHAQVLLAEHDSAHKHWENESNNIHALMTELSRIKDENESLRADAERYRKLSKVTPYRFKKMQDSSVTDGGDVLYFHADRFASLLDAISSPENPSQ